MEAWQASPYRAIGIYLGGANRACPDGNLTPAWVNGVRAGDWSLLPLWVGLQAPCPTASAAKLGLKFINPSSAGTQGKSAADSAATRAAYFGIGAGYPDLFRHGGLQDDRCGLHHDRAEVRRGLGGRAARQGLCGRCLRERQLDDPRPDRDARSRLYECARRHLDRALERRRERLRRPGRLRHVLGPAPARPSVPGRSRRDLGRREAERRQQLRGRRRGRGRRHATDGTACRYRRLERRPGLRQLVGELLRDAHDGDAHARRRWPIRFRASRPVATCCSSALWTPPQRHR